MNNYGTGDTEEDKIFEQLHKDLNDIDIERKSSPANEIISISDSLDEVEEDVESSTTGTNLSYFIVIFGNTVLNMSNVA